MTEENPQEITEQVEPPKKAPKTPTVMPHTARARAAAIAKIKARKGQSWRNTTTTKTRQMIS